jgi:hypothetical protein
MTQAYSAPDREDDLYALPDIETFYLSEGQMDDKDGNCFETGWYWWACFPGCLPDGEPMGPFKTEAEALEDAQVTSPLANIRGS